MGKWIRRSAIAIVLALGVSMGTATAAGAVTTYPEGGTWQYGVYTPAGTDFVYSFYYHPRNWHRASVQVTNGTIYRSADQPKGKWAKVEKATGWWGRKSFYFRYSY